MSRWFRSHAAKLDNPKVQKLSDALYRAWDSLLCVACRHDGVLPSSEDTAFALRKSKAVTAKLIEALIDAGLFVKTERGVEPHEWSQWQYKSDVSTDRVKQHRERQRNVSSNVPATPSENREQKQKDSEANASGADAPDPVKKLFDDGVDLLVSTGCGEKSARSMIGKWRSQHGDTPLAEAFAAARVQGITEPIAWITMRFAGKPRESWREKQIREGEATIDRALQ